MLNAHADHDNWLTYGHGYANQRYGGLEQITTDNAHRLVPKWIYQTGVLGTLPTNPLVVDGTMYLTTPYNHVVALDAATGLCAGVTRTRCRLIRSGAAPTPGACPGLRTTVYGHRGRVPGSPR